MSRERNSVGVLLRIPIFRRLWMAIAVSSFGDWLGLLATTALAAYLTQDTSSLLQGAAISGVLVTRLLPDLVLGPIAGALVDRFDRRKLAVIGDSMAALLYLSIALVGNLTWLLIAQFIVEGIGLFTNPAKQAMWVNIVPRERLAAANQMNYVSIYGMVPVAALAFATLSTVSKFFAPTSPDAPAPSAMIVGASNPMAINIALMLDAATYLVVAGTIFFSRKLIPPFTGERNVTRNIFSLVAEGVSFISRNRMMRAIYIGVLGAFGAGGLVAGVAQAYVATLGASSAGYGILFGTVFSGLALGMLIGPKVLPTVPRRSVFSSSIGAAGIMLLVMAMMRDFTGAAITSIVMGVFAGIAWITGFTMIGHEVADHLRGRVFAFVMSSVRLALLVTIVLGPILAGGLGSYLISVGQFRWTLTSPALVLGVGGVLAVGVSLFAGHQISHGATVSVWRRVLGRRGKELWATDEHSGVYIVVEGEDVDLVARYRVAVAAHVREAGYRVVDAGDLGIRAAGYGGGQDDGNGGYDAAPAGSASALRAIAGIADAVALTVRPALEAESVVVCSGYIDAAVVRFGVLAGHAEEDVLATARWACEGLQPDLTVVVREQGTPEPELSAAYRRRSETAPERYFTVLTNELELPHEVSLTLELGERVGSLLRQIEPARDGAAGSDGPAGSDVSVSDPGESEPTVGARG